jgi:hypothetical protein
VRIVFAVSVAGVVLLRGCDDDRGQFHGRDGVLDQGQGIENEVRPACGPVDAVGVKDPDAAQVVAGRDDLEYAVNSGC